MELSAAKRCGHTRFRFILSKSKIKERWTSIFSFIYLIGNFSVLLYYCSFVARSAPGAWQICTRKKLLNVTDNSKATNYRNFMPPAASGIKHSFQPCFYLLNLDKLIMLLMMVRETLKWRNCIAGHKNNRGTVFYTYCGWWKICH